MPGLSGRTASNKCATRTSPSKLASSGFRRDHHVPGGRHGEQPELTVPGRAVDDDEVVIGGDGTQRLVQGDLRLPVPAAATVRQRRPVFEILAASQSVEPRVRPRAPRVPHLTDIGGV